MNLDLTPEDIEFRAEVRAFLAENLTPELADAGRLATSVFIEPEFTMPWQRILHKRGWVAPHWPKEYGGTGWNEMQRYIFASECALAGAPGLSPMGLAMVGPCIIGYGTPEQKAHYLPRLLAGEDYWCQGYSEPGSGSDLASLQLRGVSDGDHYVLNGTKIWTTHAHHANKMFCLVRTDPDAKPQKGITFLLLDMKTPGIKVDPIITLAGEHELNQVFFDDVRVPKSGRLGEENDGWSVAKYLLEFERGGGSSAGLHAGLSRLKQVVFAAADTDPGLLRRLSSVSARLDAEDPAHGTDAGDRYIVDRGLGRACRGAPASGLATRRQCGRAGRPSACDRHGALPEQPGRLDLWRLQRGAAQYHGEGRAGPLTTRRNRSVRRFRR